MCCARGAPGFIFDLLQAPTRSQSSTFRSPGGASRKEASGTKHRSLMCQCSKIPKADTEDNEKDEDSVPEHVDIPDDEQDLENEDPDEEDDEEDERHREHRNATRGYGWEGRE